MSRRRLVFTESQVYFQCQQGQWFECLSAPLPFNTESLTYPVFRIERSDKVERCTQTFRSIEDYARRELTYKHDKLRAFLGVLNQLKSREPATSNLLGLPLFSSANIERSLNSSWNDRDPMITASDTNDLVQALSWSWSWHKGDRDMWRDGTFPSWTWLGWHRKREAMRSYKYTIFHCKPALRNGFLTNHTSSVALKFSDGELTPWESPWNGLCDKVLAYPDTSIRICGYLCFLPVKFDENRHITPYFLDAPGLCHFTIQDLYFGPSGGYLRALFGQRHCTNLTCVLLLSHFVPMEFWYSRAPCDSRVYFCLMVLKELPEKCAYERVDVITLEADEEFHIRPNGGASIGPLEFYEGTVTIQ